MTDAQFRRLSASLFKLRSAIYWARVERSDLLSKADPYREGLPDSLPEYDERVDVLNHRLDRVRMKAHQIRNRLRREAFRPEGGVANAATSGLPLIKVWISPFPNQPPAPVTNTRSGSESKLMLVGLSRSGQVRNA